MANSTYLSLSHIAFQFNSGRQLWQDLNVTLNTPLQALVGRNGVGKSTLGKLLAGRLSPTSGQILSNGKTYYLPQNYLGNPNDSLAIVLGVEKFHQAQFQLEQGCATDYDFAILEHHWDWKSEIDQFAACLNLTFTWDLDAPWYQFSGGQQSRLLLLAALIQKPDILILDEPSNHLDTIQKQQLLDWLLKDDKIVKLVISHDRFLLQQIDIIYELTQDHIHKHAGTLSAYIINKQQRQQEQQTLLEFSDKQLKKQKRALQESIEKTQRRASQGKRKAMRRDISKMETDFNIESGTKGRSSQLRRHRQALEQSQQRRLKYYQEREWNDDIHIDLPLTEVAANKQVLKLRNLICGYHDFQTQPLHLTMRGPRRLHLHGQNGSGKSTLLSTLQGKIPPISGDHSVYVHHAYLDQHLSILHPKLSSWENYRQINPQASPERTGEALATVGLKAAKHELPFTVLSGSEQLRVAIATLFMGDNAPQLLLLDEPSNHLDLETVDTLITALNRYKGALIIASHDKYLINNIRIDQTLALKTMPEL